MQQIKRETGVPEGPLLREIHRNYGINPLAKAILKGTYVTTYSVSEEQAEWFRGIKKTRRERESPAVLGYMDTAQFQQTFKVAREQTSSSAARLYYTIWKVMAECDYLAEFLAVILNLPFTYIRVYL